MKRARCPTRGGTRCDLSYDSTVTHGVSVLVLLSLLLGLLGCTPCAGQPTSGITFSLADARDGAPICDAVAIASDSRITERLDLIRPRGRCVYNGVINRPGEFDIFIMAEGYLPKTIESYEVEVDGCGFPKTREFPVTLEPDPNAPPRDAGTD